LYSFVKVRRFAVAGTSVSEPDTVFMVVFISSFCFLALH